MLGACIALCNYSSMLKATSINQPTRKGLASWLKLSEGIVVQTFEETLEILDIFRVYAAMECH